MIFFKRFATDDSWYYKVGVVPNPVENALDSYEKALRRTEFRGKNEKGPVCLYNLHRVRLCGVDVLITEQRSTF